MNSGVFEPMHRSANNRFQDTSLRFYKLKQSADAVKSELEIEASSKAHSKTRSKSTSSYAPPAKSVPPAEFEEKENKVDLLENESTVKK